MGLSIHDGQSGMDGGSNTSAVVLSVITAAEKLEFGSLKDSRTQTSDFMSTHQT